MLAQEHILVVDHSGEVRDILVELLREYGYRVSWAVNGESMREFLQGSDPVIAVVLDALTPGENGITLALYVKNLGLPLVMISGSHKAMTFAEENNLQLLHKPFRGKELVDAVIKAINSGKPGRRSENP